MTSCQDSTDLLNQRLVEIDTTPDLSKSKPVVTLKQEEIDKLIRQFEMMKEAWIALKFNETICVIWKDLIFLFSTNREEEL
ncbi:MAG: hypothetical protein ABSG57_01565 [Candidatus Bathyarchaeia archaeon]|jgi:hypothetical protein